MIGVPATLVVGNPRRGSRTMAVACQATDVIRERLARAGVPVAVPEIVDLAEFGPRLPARLLAGSDEHGLFGPVLDLVRVPGLLVVASPTFKGSYTGLLKLFMDMLPRDALAGTVAVPLTTAAWAQHRFVADTYLRALLVELGAAVPVPGLSIIESEFTHVDAAIAAWAGAAVPVLAPVLQQLSGHGRPLVSSVAHGPAENVIG
ncbi:MAG TPA: NAD(P)H-dependent oxidoreductase [Rugosimonospora sp.]|nr:NAD(P)H-dependent oxidoreductase [Rugosimonospora sp.]